MANTSIQTTESTNPADPNVAVDRIAGEDFQRIKSGWGPEGTYNDTDDANGKRMPVNVAESAVLDGVRTDLANLDSSVAGVETAVGGVDTRAGQIRDRLGATNEAAPANDTDVAALNGRLQRIAQRLTSLIALLPASLGSKAAANSLAVTDSTEDIARMGATNEAAPAGDTTSGVGLNGRLQRIAQRLTSLIALLPTALTTNGGALKTGAGEANLTLTVTAGNTTSSSVDTAGLRNMGLWVQSTFDGSQIQFEVSADNTNFYGLYDINNTRVIMTVAGDRAYDLPGELLPWRYWRIVCSTTQTVQNTDFGVRGRT